MALIEKGDLKYDYSWTSNLGKNPKFEGKPDSNLFDREEGHEVLYLINEYAKENNIDDKETAREIENQLRKNLDKNLTTQRSVFEWITSRFKNKS
ncbi:MAG: hypothetical protein U5K69_12190 [Balneolaceae bacterium]|nr:hypothetical protein [Balneolaceae bacterium]